MTGPPKEKPNQNGKAVNGHGLASQDALTPAGFSRLELVRLMVQSMQGLGYSLAAKALEEESGYSLESSTVSKFREQVLKGQWAEVEELAQGLELDPIHSAPVVKFLIRKQKFLEMLEARQIKNALDILRTELTPLNQGKDQLHLLSSYMMSGSAEDLRERADWDGANGTSRQKLLTNLQKFISPSIMVPELRLETLLLQAKDLQRRDCLYHDDRNNSNTLYSDHICDKKGIPTVTRHLFDKHTNEVWYVAFSHNGKYLASTSVDNQVIIWDVEAFEAVHILQSHSNKVTFCAWSPDDSKLLTAGMDKTVKYWDVKSGTCISTFSRHTEIVLCLAWLPDGKRFVSGSEKNLFLMNTSGDLIHAWAQSHVRDLAISADGQTLVTIWGSIIKLINLRDKTETTLEESDKITAICLSRDGKFLLANTTFKPAHLPTHREIHLWNLQEGRIVCKYTGHKQGLYVIRSCFGGYNERYVISGSEDRKIYIWHRDNGNLVQVLEGHSSAVTCVSWNPNSPTMFASGSDDSTIRIWGTPEDIEEDSKRFGMEDD